MRYARELFCNKQFPEAMKEFELASADAYDVIRLFPNLLPEKSTTKGDSSDAAAQMPLQNMPELKEKDLENGLLALTDFLIATRGKIKNSKKSSKLLLSIIATTLLKCYLQVYFTIILS